MQVVIDERVNKVIEEYFLNLNYEVIKINKDIKLYSEISSHTDINFFKLENNIYLNNNLKNIISVIPKKYNIYSDIDIFLNCIKLNICLIDKFAIHNFKMTDINVLNKLKDLGYTLINVKQGYSRCSILPLKNKCCITSDKGIYNILLKNNFDVMYLENNLLDIKLLNKDNSYSSMKGFIGGCSFVIDNTVIFFGDLDNFKCKDKLVSYIISKGYKIKDFKNIDMIDYGSCIILD